MLVRNKERHRTGCIGWLRAVVLGANGGILSKSRSDTRGSFKLSLRKG
jgi:hypothetical protein